MAVVAPTAGGPKSATPPSGAAFKPRTKWIAYGLLLPGGLWLLLFWLWPTIQMGLVSLQTGSFEEGYTLTWNFAIYGEVISSNSVQLIRSVEYALIVTIGTLAIGYPLAYGIAMRGGKWKNALLFLVVLPFFVSYVIRTLSWKFILADDGMLFGLLKDIGILPDDFQVLATPVAVISGLIYNFLPFMVLPLYVSIEKIDPSLLEAAGDLYSNRRTAFFKVTLPLSLPGVFAGSLLTFIPVAGDFVNAKLLGSVNTTMIGNVIEREMLVNNDYPGGSALAFLLMAAILIGVLVYARLIGTEELTG